MSAVSEAVERAQFALALAGAHARRIARMLVFGHDEALRPAVLVLPYARHLLAQALREAADACEVLGVEQGDQRWVGIVALIHHASGMVWTVRSAKVFEAIANQADLLRLRALQLRDRGMRSGGGGAVSVWLD